MDNYNKFLKENLGSKNSLTRINFIYFIKTDSEKKENILGNKKINTNFLNDSQNTKYSLDIIEKTMIDSDINNSNNELLFHLYNNINYKNPFLAEFKWIT